MMRVHSFVLKDPNADLISKDFSIYITWKEPRDEGFVFQGYMWDVDGIRTVSDGYITPDSIKFMTSVDENQYQNSQSSRLISFEYHGHFSSKTTLYHGNYRPYSEFAIKNQTIVFPTSQAPLSPMILYKQDIFHELERQHHGMKISELNSLVAHKWENLNEEERKYYEKRYEESVIRYKDYWEDNVKPLSQHSVVKHLRNLKSPSNDRYLTHIFESIKYNEYHGPGGAFGYQEHDYHENEMCKPSASWINALAYIQKKYRRFVEAYENQIESLYSGNSLVKRRSSYTYSIHWFSFKATIIDRKEEKASTISVSKLNTELNKHIQRVSRDKKYLTLHILREKDFDPQTIREVLLLLPKPEIIFCNKPGCE